MLCIWLQFSQLISCYNYRLQDMVPKIVFVRFILSVLSQPYRKVVTRESENREVIRIFSSMCPKIIKGRVKKFRSKATLILTVWILRELKTVVRLTNSDYIVASRPASNSVSQSATQFFCPIKNMLFGLNCEDIMQDVRKKTRLNLQET